MITPQTYVKLSTPIILSLHLSDGPRVRDTSDEVGDEWDTEFQDFPLDVRPDCYARTLVAYLSPIPTPLPIYGPEDFSAACGDTMEEHAERVLEILGDDPAVTLQALIDGEELPPMPPRVPREVAHWRMEYILRQWGYLDKLDSVFAALDPESQDIARSAWTGLSAINIKSPFIALAAPILGFTPQRVTDLFIACAAIPA